MKTLFFLVFSLMLNTVANATTRPNDLTVVGQLFPRQNGYFFRPKKSVGNEYPNLFRLEASNDTIASFVRSLDKPKIVEIVGHFSKSTLSDINGDYGKVQVWGLTSISDAANYDPLYIQDMADFDDAHPQPTGQSRELARRAVVPSATALELYADELRGVKILDPNLKFKTAGYVKFLSDPHTLARIKREEGGREAILNLRRLVLANMLFMYFPKTRKFIRTKAFKSLLQVGAELWEEGSHGVFYSVVAMMEDHLDYAVMTADLKCSYLLEHFGEDPSDEILNLKSQALLDLQQIRLLNEGLKIKRTPIR